jgi:hypothetical protein
MSGLTTRLALAAAAGVAVLIVAATTMWFLGDALLLWLEANGFVPAAAAGITGLAGVVLAGLFGLWARWLLRPHPRARAAVPASAPAAGANGSAVNGYAAELGALVASQLVTSTRAHPYKTMGAALAAGLAVGAVPELRKTLTDLLKH